MTYRFRRTIKLAPGIRMNIGKKGGSISVGGRGGSISFGSRGVYKNIGLPGSGLSYRSKIGDQSSRNQGITSSKGLQSKGENTVRAKISVELNDDGSVIYKYENGDLLTDEHVRQVKHQGREYIASVLENKCNEINQANEDLINIHRSTQSPDTEILFVPANFDEPQPVQPSANFPEPKPTQPTLKEYGSLAKRMVIFRNNIDKKNNELQENYKNRLKKWDESKAYFEVNYITEFREYQEKLNLYNNRLIEFNEKQEKRKKFIEVDRLNDINIMQDFIAEALETIIWPRETIVSFDIDNDGKSVFLDVDLPEIDDMPERESIVNKRDLRLNFREISETQRRKNYYAHIHAIGFRLIGEVFVSLPTISTVVFSGYSQRPDKKTGNITNEYLYSVRVSRDKWEKINFSNLDAIDVSECFKEFDLRRNATKTGVMTPIEPFRL